MATWPEPLSAMTQEVDGWTVAVTTTAGDGTPVARVLCTQNAAAGYGVFGEMQIVDAGGSPQQRQRALVLLVREALRYAAAVGIVRAHTEAPPRMAAFASRMCGLAGDAHGDRLIFRGDVYAMRSTALDASDAAGNLRDALAGGVDVQL
jgi:hypothetical protein